MLTYRSLRTGRQTVINPVTVNNDVSTNTATKADVASLVSAFDSSLRWCNCNQRMDFNMHYKIDTTDLAAAASSVSSN
jgi:hypothetical protein